jgi:hypothetical protein
MQPVGQHIASSKYGVVHEWQKEEAAAVVQAKASCKDQERESVLGAWKKRQLYELACLGPDETKRARGRVRPTDRATRIDRRITSISLSLNALELRTYLIMWIVFQKDDVFQVCNFSSLLNHVK